MYRIAVPFSVCVSNKIAKLGGVSASDVGSTMIAPGLAVGKE
jgi:hypothetical protein